MKRPAIFFDRDNTLTACRDYLGDPSQVALVSGAADAVARAKALGYATVVISNQSGVARGMFTEAAVHAVNQRMDELLAEENAGAVIDRHEFCPFHPEGTVEAYRQESDRRKPGPGMLHSAAQALDLDLSRSWLVGDAPRDIEAGAAAGCKTILFSDPSLAASPAASAQTNVQPDYSVTTLKEAINVIESQTQSTQNDSNPAPQPPTSEQDMPLPASAADTVSSQAAAWPSAPSNAKLESIGNEILRELRRQQMDRIEDFSVSKLLAGIVQVLVLAVLFLAYIYRADDRLLAVLLFALVLQTMTIALLIMGRQK